LNHFEYTPSRSGVTRFDLTYKIKTFLPNGFNFGKLYMFGMNEDGHYKFHEQIERGKYYVRRDSFLMRGVLKSRLSEVKNDCRGYAVLY